MGKITINELHKSLFDYVQAVSDDKLETNNKTIVGAINELFSDNSNDIEINNLKNEISNGKELIANAIGEPLTAEDSFDEMSSDINSLLSTFKTNMMNNGITVESGDKFKSLIDKIATMVEEGSGKGIQFAEYTYDENFYLSESSSSTNYTINELPLNLDFQPTYLFIKCSYIQSSYLYLDSFDILISNTMECYVCDKSPTKIAFSITDLNAEKATIRVTLPNNNGGPAMAAVLVLGWYAIGVGEEDTTLRDSLADILQEEGVDVTEEDDMASLITKINDLNIINTDKNQIMTYKVDEITYNIDFSNPGLDYFNAFVKGEFIYFIVQDAGTSASNYLERTCYCKFIKYNMNTKTIVLEKVHQNYDNDYRYRIDAAYLADDAIYIIAEFGLYSVNLNDFNVTQIVRNTYNSTVNSKTFRIGDVIYFTADGYNYDYSAIVRAYNVKTKQLISELTFPRISTGADRDEYLYFMCPDLINDKIYFAGGDTAYPLYQTDLNLNVIKSVNLSGTGDLIYKINSRYAFANSTTLSIINQGNGTVGSFSAYPNVIEINVDNLSSNYTTRSLNCECFFDVNASVSTISTYSYRQAPCIEYYSHYMFMKHEDTFVRINTLDGTAVNVPIPVYFKIFRVIDEETIECITRTGISTFRIKEI